VCGVGCLIKGAKVHHNFSSELSTVPPRIHFQGRDPDMVRIPGTSNILLRAQHVPSERLNLVGNFSHPHIAGVKCNQLEMLASQSTGDLPHIEAVIRLATAGGSFIFTKSFPAGTVVPEDQGVLLRWVSAGCPIDESSQFLWVAHVSFVKIGVVA